MYSVDGVPLCVAELPLSHAGEPIQIVENRQTPLISREQPLSMDKASKDAEVHQETMTLDKYINRIDANNKILVLQLLRKQ